MLIHTTGFGVLLALVSIAFSAFAPTFFVSSPELTPGYGPNINMPRVESQLPASADVTVSDVDPEVSFTAPESITEGEPAVFTFTRVGSISDELALNLDFFLEGQFLQDYEIDELRFAAGEATAVLSIPTEDDDTPEPDGYIGVHLQPRYYTPGIPQPYHREPPFYREVAVMDNDRPAVTSIVIPSPSDQS